MFVTEAEYFDTPSIGNGKSSPVVSDVVDGKNKKVEELQAEVQKAKAKGNFDDAIDILWKILGLDARNVMAWEDLTDCLLKGNKYDIAEMAIQEVIKFEPERIDFYLTYLDIVLRTHNSMDYVRILRETKQKFPRDADLCLLWARAQEMYIGDGKKAKHFYEKFLQLAPERHPEISKVQRLLERYPEG
jgi:tetratricopeptide (TPR) repeat protein